MSETLVIALVAAAASVGGAAIHALVASRSHHEDAQNTSAQLLLKAQNQLRDELEDNQLLWAYNRSLIDHIFKGSPPPPPAPPAGLFDHS